MPVLRYCLAMLTFALAVSVQSTGAQDALTVRKSHSETLHGARLEYESDFDRFFAAEPGQPPGATLTTLAYLEAPPAGQPRPVIFAFNGGPGAPSVFLNVGLLGPKRADLPAAVRAAIPAHPRLVPNAESVLDVADLVLIDPVGTGLSRLTVPRAAHYFYSVQGDAASVAGVIAEWSRRHQRSASAKFILGESYGAVRAVEVVNELAKTDQRDSVKGIILLSQSLPILDTVQRPSNIVGQVVGLGTIAASAWYHGLAGKNEPFEKFVGEARQFGTNIWLPALFSGSALDERRRHDAAHGLARYTGLSPQYFLDHNLYLSKDAYRREALAAEGLILGAADTRYTGPASTGSDPSGVLSTALLSTATDVLRDEFGLLGTTDYRSTDGLDEWVYVQQPFDPTTGRHYAQMDYAAHLVGAMTALPHLSVFVAGGWFDTYASAGADDYLVSRPGLDRGRITSHHYIGGHMFYTDPRSRIQFAKDLRRFLSGGS